jgi:hypothetical protein
VVDQSLPLGACSCGIMGLKSSQEQRYVSAKKFRKQKWDSIGPQASLKKNENEKEEEAKKKKEEKNLFQATKQTRSIVSRINL